MISPVWRINHFAPDWLRLLCRVPPRKRCKMEAPSCRWLGLPWLFLQSFWWHSVPLERESLWLRLGPLYRSHTAHFFLRLKKKFFLRRAVGQSIWLFSKVWVRLGFRPGHWVFHCSSESSVFWRMEAWTLPINQSSSSSSPHISTLFTPALMCFSPKFYVFLWLKVLGLEWSWSKDITVKQATVYPCNTF